MSNHETVEDCDNCGCVGCIIELAKELYIKDYPLTNSRGVLEPRTERIAEICLTEAEAFFRAVENKYPDA